MANLASQPDTANIVLNWTQSNSFATGSPAKKYVPKDLAGSPIDFSVGTWGCVVQLAAPTPRLPNATAGGAATVTAADASGITIQMTQSDATTTAGAMTANNAKVTLFVSDGTNTLIAATGNVVLNLTP